jgi:hypothetical protein
MSRYDLKVDTVCVIFLMIHVLYVSANVGPGTECMS